MLGPVLFNIYLLPLSDIIRRHNLRHHFYADDTQLYISATPTQSDVYSKIKQLEACSEDIKHWMTLNYLKLNDEKTDVLIIGSSSSLKKLPKVDVSVGFHSINPVPEVKTLGVTFDKHMNMQSHIKSVSRIAMYHLYNISKIKRFIGRRSTEQIIHMLVTSRIDYCNAILAGLPATTLAPL